jgi:hypothetical protein
VVATEGVGVVGGELSGRVEEIIAAALTLPLRKPQASLPAISS